MGAVEPLSGVMVAPEIPQGVLVVADPVQSVMPPPVWTA